jgi:hypothetical protein
MRISPEETRKIKVKFVGKEVGKFNCSIIISPRGGQKKIL